MIKVIRLRERNNRGATAKIYNYLDQHRGCAYTRVELLNALDMDATARQFQNYVLRLKRTKGVMCKCNGGIGWYYLPVLNTQPNTNAIPIPSNTPPYTETHTGSD